MGEGKGMEYSKINEAKKKEEKKGALGKNSFFKALLLGSALTVSTFVLPKCSEEERTVISNPVSNGKCSSDKKARANLNVISGWGYDVNDEEMRCSNSSGCKMGVNLGDEIIVLGEENEEKWKVAEIKKEENGEEIVLLKPATTDESNDTRTINIKKGGALYTDGERHKFINVSLLGICLNEETCENGISMDDKNATGKAVLAITVGEETKRVLLKDLEGISLSMGEYTIDIMLARATESQAYVIYNIVSNNINNNRRADLGEPIGEDEVLQPLEDLSIKNEVSSDSITATCRKLSVQLEITNTAMGENTSPYTVELVEGDIIESGNNELTIESLLPEIIKEDGVEKVTNAKSAISIRDKSNGEVTVLYTDESAQYGDLLIKVNGVFVRP